MIIVTWKEILCNGKHSYNKTSDEKKQTEEILHKSNKSITKKIKLTLIIILVIAILGILGFFLYLQIKTGIPLSPVTGQPVYDEKVFNKPSDIVSITDNLKVNMAEYLEITKLKIKSTEDELYTISADVENTSEESYKDIILRISFFDNNKKVITFLDYKIDNIEANNLISTFATIKRDLSDCKYYSVGLKK